MSGLITILPDLSAEFQFLTSRSSGPGGQNVNKVNSKVELRFDIQNSELLSTDQKEILLTKLASRITSEGILIIVSQRHRSQLANKEDSEKKLYTIVQKALTPAKPRKVTKPTRSSVEKRLTSKRIKSVIKQTRSKIDD
jgi:ribosome-associated protein